MWAVFEEGEKMMWVREKRERVGAEMGAGEKGRREGQSDHPVWVKDTARVGEVTEGGRVVVGSCGLKRGGVWVA